MPTRLCVFFCRTGVTCSYKSQLSPCLYNHGVFAVCVQFARTLLGNVSCLSRESLDLEENFCGPRGNVRGACALVHTLDITIN